MAYQHNFDYHCLFISRFQFKLKRYLLSLVLLYIFALDKYDEDNLDESQMISIDPSIRRRAEEEMDRREELHWHSMQG